MGLNPQGNGLVRGNEFNFKAKGQNGRGMGRRPVFRSGQSGIVHSNIGFSPQSQVGISSTFGESCGYNAGMRRPPYRKFPRGNFKKNFPSKTNGIPMREVDLTKPWVTQEIIDEENKKQKLLETWNDSNENEDWRKYKEQKVTVQTLYDRARAGYAASHPHEPSLWETPSPGKQYFCETCDKSFRTDDDLFLHKAEHETCGREGCEFTAHPKIIEKHIKMQHLSGLYKRIGKLYTEEDITKWIEERKKNYPTRKVIEEKKILEQEKYNRGERIKDNDSKFNKSFKNKNNKRTGRKNFEKKVQRNNSRKLKKNKQPVTPKCLEEESLAVRRSVPAFKGIGGTSEPEVQEKKDFDISDDDWEADPSVPKGMTPQLNNSLGLLASLYDSDVEEENKPQKETKQEDVSMDEDSGPEEVKTISSKKPLPEESSNEGSRPVKRKFSGKRNREEKRNKNDALNNNQSEKRSLTLLEKLLKNEIRHERNVILQCVHYVTKNNFFMT